MNHDHPHRHDFRDPWDRSDTVMWITVCGCVLIALALILLADNLMGEDSVTITGITQITQASTGHGSGGANRQTSANAFGVATEYRHWWYSNGIQVEWSTVQTNARFVNVANPSDALMFGLRRQQFTAEYVKRWNWHQQVNPYAGVGGGIWLTNGGWAPGGVVGRNVQGLLCADLGAETPIGHGLSVRYGLSVTWYRAPNFSDSAYHGAHIVTLAPKIGINWIIPRKMEGK